LYAAVAIEDIKSMRVRYYKPILFRVCDENHDGFLDDTEFQNFENPAPYILSHYHAATVVAIENFGNGKGGKLGNGDKLLTPEELTAILKHNTRGNRIIVEALKDHVEL
jgi:hypothetical protein